MILSQKEKQYAIVVGVLAACFVVYEVAWLPYQAQLADIDTQTATLKAQKELDDKDRATRDQLRPVWAEIQAGGLKTDEQAAETQALDAILDWAQAARVQIESMKAERATVEGGFKVLEYHITAKGATAQVAKLIWSLESATIPVRVSDIQLNSNKEGTDDLTLQMSVSTLCMPQPTPPPAPQAPTDKPGTRPGTPVSSQSAGGAR